MYSIFFVVNGQGDIRGHCFMMENEHVRFWLFQGLN